MATIEREDVMGWIGEASILDINQLVTDLEEKFGITAAAPVAVAGALEPQTPVQIALQGHRQRRRLKSRAPLTVF